MYLHDWNVSHPLLGSPLVDIFMLNHGLKKSNRELGTNNCCRRLFDEKGFLHGKRFSWKRKCLHARAYSDICSQSVARPQWMRFKQDHNCIQTWDSDRVSVCFTHVSFEIKLKLKHNTFNHHNMIQKKLNQNAEKSNYYYFNDNNTQ